MRARFLTFTIIFIPTYTLYLKTMPPTVFWQDSGIFLAGIKMLGVIYPPGFPLYIVLGALWTKIFSALAFIPLNFAQQVHAFSGLWGAGAAGFVGLSVYELISSCSAVVGGGRRVTRGGEPHAGAPGLLAEWATRGAAERQDPSPSKVTLILIATIAGLTAGFSYSLWSQSINAEVYSMIGFFSALILFITVKMIQGWPKKQLTENDFTQLSKSVRKYLFYLSAVWGLSFGVHLLTITFFLPLLYLSFTLGFSPFIHVWIEEKKTYQNLIPLKTWLAALLIFFFFILTPYLFLPLRSVQDPLLLWSPIDSPQAFLAHITGASYRQTEGAIQVADLEKLRSYSLLIFQEFYPLGLLLGLLGWWVILKGSVPKQKHLAIFGLIYTVLIYLLISFYQRGTEYNFWLIPFYLYFSLSIGAGLWWITHLIKPVAFKTFLLPLLALGLWGPQLWVNWPILNRANYTLAEEFGKNLIGKLPQNSIFFTLGDQESSIPMYLQLVLGYRQDVVVIAPSDLVYRWRRERLTKFHPDLWVPTPKTGDLTPEESGEVINNFLAGNLPQRPLFVITKNYLPLEAPFRLTPAGTIWQVTSEENPEIDLFFWQYSFSDPGRYERPERKELSRKKRSFEGDKEIVTYERAPYFAETQVFELQGKKNLGDLCFGSFREGEALKVKTVEGQHETWQGEKLLECAQNSYEEMFKIDPKFFHRDIFSNLADLYQKIGKTEEAKRLREQLEKKP